MAVPIVTPYVNGGRLPRRRRPAEPVTAPFDGRLLARLVAGDGDDLDLAIAGARAAQRQLAAMPRHRRAAILEATARLIGQERTSLARLMARDAGKPIALAAAEVDRAVTVFGQAADAARRFGVSALPADSQIVVVRVDPRTLAVTGDLRFDEERASNGRPMGHP